jgi:hypothetical protein
MGVDVLKEKLKIPQGIHAVVIKPTYGNSFTVNLFERNKKGFYEQIGHVNLEKYGKTYTTHSRLYNDKYKNKGFGLYMYATAIKFMLKYDKKCKVKSHINNSDDAQRLWKSKRLNTLFKIVTSKGYNRKVFTVQSIKSQNVQTKYKRPVRKAA